MNALAAFVSPPQALDSDALAHVRVALTKAVKYSPDQPRVPAGDPSGGQFAEGPGGAFVPSHATGERWKEKDETTGRENHYSRSKSYGGHDMTMSGPYEDEYSEMMGYLNTGFKINQFLRDRKSDDTDVMPLDRLISRNTLNEDAVVYRSIDPGVMAGMRVGDTFKDYGFVSTTWGKKTAQRLSEAPPKPGFPPVGGRHIVTIDLKAGQHALEVGQYEDDKWGSVSEQEYLLPRGGTFVVTGVESGVVTRIRSVP